jgi:hypothetical protein
MPLTITVLGANERVLYSARTVVNVSKTAPDGVKCGPVCFRGGVMFAPRIKRFVEFEGHAGLAQMLKAEAFAGLHAGSLRSTLRSVPAGRGSETAASDVTPR